MLTCSLNLQIIIQNVYSSLFWRPFSVIATVKFKSILNQNTSSNKMPRRKCCTILFSFLPLRGGVGGRGKNGLNARPTLLNMRYSLSVFKLKLNLIIIRNMPLLLTKYSFYVLTVTKYHLFQIVNVLSLWSILMVTDFTHMSSQKKWLFVGSCSTIISYEFILGIVRVQDYFQAYYSRLVFLFILFTQSNF